MKRIFYRLNDGQICEPEVLGERTVMRGLFKKKYVKQYLIVYKQINNHYDREITKNISLLVDEDDPNLIIILDKHKGDK